jgi:hypothetical protein
MYIYTYMNTGQVRDTLPSPMYSFRDPYPVSAAGRAGGPNGTVRLDTSSVEFKGIYIHIFISIYIYLFIYTCVFMSVYIYVHIYLYIYVYTYTYIYVYIYVYKHVYIYPYISIHVYRSWFACQG